MRMIILTIALALAGCATSGQDPMYYPGFGPDTPPTAEQAAEIAKRDGGEFAEFGIDPEYCTVFWSVDSRCFIGDAFKCWDS